MSNKKSFHHQSDETLFNSGRKGNQVSIGLLFNRYYHKKDSLGRLCNAEGYEALDEDRANDAFTDAFMRCFQCYSTKKSKFKTFFQAVYRNTINDQLREKVQEAENIAFGLDQPLSLDESDYYCLSDIIPDNGMVSPKEFYDYAETLEKMKKLPPHLDKRALKVARLVHIEGYTCIEAAKVMHIKRERARYLLKIYNAWIKKVLKGE